MADILTRRGARGRGCIDLHEEWECRYWSKRFGVRPKVLKAAVRQVGYKIEDVERYLREVEERQRFSKASTAWPDLVPCPHCGAVNELTATACHQCNADLATGDTKRPGPITVAPDVPVEAIDPPGDPSAEKAEGQKDIPAKRMLVLLDAKPERKQFRRVWLAAIGAVIAVVAFGYYYVERQQSAPETTARQNPGSEARNVTRPISPPASSAPSPSTPSAESASSTRRAASKPAPASPASAPPAPARSADSCTDAVAALGLCTKGAVQTSQGASADTPASGRIEKRARSTPCTEAAAALGLCSTSGNDRKE